MTKDLNQMDEHELKFVKECISKITCDDETLSKIDILYNNLNKKIKENEFIIKQLENYIASDDESAFLTILGVLSSISIYYMGIFDFLGRDFEIFICALIAIGSLITGAINEQMIKDDKKQAYRDVDLTKEKVKTLKDFSNKLLLAKDYNKKLKDFIER